ncbi:hypothetical protein [Natronobacterium texcoconense]|nr:hypothetical protein [Natronobacterium texcoconense]
MSVTRRELLGGAGAVLLAGCLSADAADTDCETEIETEERTLVDEGKTVTAGSSFTWPLDLEDDVRIAVDVRTIDGARPTLEVENPDGDTILETDPDGRLEREFRADGDGRYYVTLENTALLNAGTWDVRLVALVDYEVENCD